MEILALFAVGAASAASGKQQMFQAAEQAGPFHSR